jgi:DNA-binding protein YbaB
MRKKTFMMYMASLFAGCALVVSCDNENSPVEVAKLEVSPTTFNVAADGGDVLITVSGNVAWTVACDSAWVTVSDQEAQSFVINVAVNEAAEARTAIVTVTASSLEKTITVTQAGVEAGGITLSVTPESVDAAAEGETKKLAVTSNSDWTATSDQAWAAVSPASGSNNGEITVAVEANDSIERTAVITVKAADKIVTIPVKQAAKDTGVVLSVTPDSVSVAAAGETKILTVTSNSNWTAESDQTWAAVSPTDSLNNAEITVIVAANDSTERTAVITVRAADKSVAVIIEQEAKKEGGN